MSPARVVSAAGAGSRQGPRPTDGPAKTGQWRMRSGLRAAETSAMLEIPATVPRPQRTTGIGGAPTPPTLPRSMRLLLARARTEERRRIARDLHDGAQQRLVHTVLAL